MVFHHKMSARDHIQGIKNLKLFLNLYTLYYQTIRQKVDKNAYLDTICWRQHSPYNEAEDMESDINIRGINPNKILNQQ